MMRDRLQEAKISDKGLAWKYIGEWKQQTEYWMDDIMFNQILVGSKYDQVGE